MIGKWPCCPTLDRTWAVVRSVRNRPAVRVAPEKSGPCLRIVSQLCCRSRHPPYPPGVYRLLYGLTQAHHLTGNDEAFPVHSKRRRTSQEAEGVSQAAGQRIKSEEGNVSMADIPPAAGEGHLRPEEEHAADPAAGPEAAAPVQATDPPTKRESHDSKVTPSTPAAAAPPLAPRSARDPNVRLVVKQAGQTRLVREVHLDSAATRNPPLPPMIKFVFKYGEQRVERWIHKWPARRPPPPPAPAPPPRPPSPSPAPASRGRLNKVIYGWGEHRIVEWVREPAAESAPLRPPPTPPRPDVPPVVVPPVPSPPPRPPPPGPGRKWTKLIVRQGEEVRVNRWVNLPNEEG